MSQPRESAARVPDLGRFRVGDWTVHQAENTLCWEERSVRLEPRVMDVLVCLAEEPGRVVPKEEILAAVWSGAFVEEGALSQVIHTLRKTLGDDARQPRYIQTIPKRGYRLVAPVAPELPPPPVESRAEAPAIQKPAPVPIPPVRPASPRRWAWFVVAAITFAALLALLQLGRERPGEARVVPPRVAAARPGDTFTTEHAPRIAVLPFEDLNEPEDPIFSTGLTQEITKDLGSLSSLQVIHRTMSVQEKAMKEPHEIGAELDVDYVLQGTVQWGKREGGRSRVRIRPQLIRVDGVLVWAKSFEAEVTDILEVQEEISRRLIASLGIELLPEQSLALRESSTENLDAHRAYIRGLELKDQPFYSEEHLRDAALSFQRAVNFDPGFAAAWAELSLVHSYLAYNTDPTSERVTQARKALEKAMALGPDLPEARLAQAYYSYRCEEDFDGALKQLEEAARLFPNHAEIFKTLGLVLRRKGLLSEALRALQHAAWLDPSTGEIVWILPETHRALRNYEEADRGFDQAISQTPDEPSFWEQKALNWLAWKGDPGQARAILDESGMAGSAVIEAAAFRLDLYEGEYSRALSRLSRDWMRELAPETQARIAMAAAIARERMGDHEGALAAAETNRADLEAQLALYPNRGLFRACLAVALAQLGRQQEALSEIQQAIRMRQTDAFSGPRIREIQAIVSTILGRDGEAVQNLKWLRSKAYRGSITNTDLRLDPTWEPLRDNPGFKALLNG